MKRGALLTLMVCVAAGAMVTLAFAHTKTYPTTSSMKITDSGVSGKLSSSKGTCLANRLVTVTHNAIFVTEDLGEVRTDASGKWAVDKAPTHFEGYETSVVATAKAKRLLRNDQHKHVCGKLTKSKSFGG